VVVVQDHPALVMEFVDGVSLDAWLEKNAAADSVLRSLAEQIIGAVGFAHEKGMVHRDLKPSNVLITVSDGKPFAKVADFGLAKLLDTGPQDDGTKTGVAMGTPRFMSPEQIRDAKSVDARADVFALGCILYQMYMGRPAFAGVGIGDIFANIVNGEYDPPDASVPPEISAAIRGSLEVNADDRLASCEDLLAVIAGRKSVPVRKKGGSSFGRIAMLAGASGSLAIVALTVLAVVALLVVVVALGLRGDAVVAGFPEVPDYADGDRPAQPPSPSPSPPSSEPKGK
jgi:serine/threonine protein kinase